MLGRYEVEREGREGGKEGKGEPKAGSQYDV